MFCEVEKESAPDGAEEQEQVSEIQIGERQTVQRAKHPTMGEGRLVYDNGPAFFVADTGEVEHYEDAGWAGTGVGYSKAFGRRGTERVSLDTTDREKGPVHSRIVTHDGRAGWLVSWSDKISTKNRFHWERFEPDSGAEHETMMIQKWWIGLPKHERSRGGNLDACRPWCSMKSVGNDVFTYRRECDPAPVEKPKRAKPEQADLFAGAK